MLNSFADFLMTGLLNPTAESHPCLVPTIAVNIDAMVPTKINMEMPGLPLSNFPAYFKSDVLIGNTYSTIKYV